MTFKRGHSAWNSGKTGVQEPWNKGKTIGPSKLKLSNEEVFVENSTYARHHIKARILAQDLIPYLCEICGLGPEWQDKPMPLILDHRNGVNNDNRLMNLRFVCSNCDSQLETYKSKNRRKVGSMVEKWS